MTSTGKSHIKALLAEMAVIAVTAALLGIAWNHKLLYQALTGQTPSDTRKEAQPKIGIALPLGLMQVKELYDRKEALFVDARDSGAYASGHIAGARTFPLGESDARLPRFITEVPPTATLIVYCNGYDCHDSRELGVKFLRAGYRTVYVFEGGYPEWRDAGYPTGGGSR